MSDAHLKIAVYSTRDYDKQVFQRALEKYENFDVTFFNSQLNQNTARVVKGYDVVCIFVNDVGDRETIQELKANGVRHLALRCAGFNNVDLEAAKEAGIVVSRVEAYSPHAVAEYAVALCLAVNRKVHRAYQRIRDFNFTLNGLSGFNLYGKTIGILGTGRIGKCTARIFKGFGCKLLLYDAYPDADFAKELDSEYTTVSNIWKSSDVISLHVPLLDNTYHMVNEKTLAEMKQGVVIINTGRGGLIDTVALINGLKSGKVGAAGLDVYEDEQELFSNDFSMSVMQDDVIARLIGFSNVVVTAHQAFLTVEALANIAETTLFNISNNTNSFPDKT